MRKKSEDGIGALPIALTLITITAIILGLIALAVWSLVLPKLAPYASELNQTPPANATANATALSADAAFYYRLKNLSCATLSKDFLIVTEDNATSAVVGLVPAIPQEAEVAQSFASSYASDQATRTYSKGDETKKVIASAGNNLTLIWKDGRLYQCAENCTMRLLGQEGWQAYLDSLKNMRTGCAYFGRTPFPPSVNMSRLLSFTWTGKQNLSGFTCQDFLITGDRTYASSLLSDPGLDADQHALAWALAHQAGPMEECLDDGTGIVVFRSLTLDLSGVYKFSYSPGGGMFVNQQTRLTYYSGNVPESFLALPSQG